MDEGIAEELADFDDHRRSAKALAVVSVVAAVVWFFGLGSMLAIALGAPAHIEFRRYPDAEARRWRRVADVGLGLGFVGLFLAFVYAVL